MNLFDDETHMDFMFNKVSEQACTCVRRRYVVVDEVLRLFYLKCRNGTICPASKIKLIGIGNKLKN